MKLSANLKLACAAAFGAAAMYVAMTVWPHQLTAHYEMHAIDANGHMYIAGEGSDCMQARINAVYPGGTNKSECVMVLK